MHAYYQKLGIFLYLPKTHLKKIAPISIKYSIFV